jgi:hypothetical protein
VFFGVADIKTANAGLLWLGVSYIRILVPGTASGVLLKSKLSKMQAWAESLG